jgi:hypothetical protein
MASPYDEWSVYSEANQAHLRDRVLQVCKARPKEINRLQIALDCDFNYTNFDKWLNEYQKYAILSKARYYRLVLHGLHHGWLGTDGAALFREFSHFLGSNMEQAKEIYTRIQGHYVVHRFSYLARGYVLRGSLDITYQKELNLFSTKESYRIQGGVMNDMSLGLEDAWYNRSGFFFPRGEHSYLLVSRKDEHPSEIQMTYLEAHGQNNNLLRGQFSDWHGDKFYAARMIAPRIPHSLPKSEVLTFDQAVIDTKIKQYLTENLRVEDYLFIP